MKLKEAQDLIGGFAHDIKGPLQTMLSIHDLLVNQGSPSQKNSVLDAMFMTIQKMMDIADEATEVSVGYTSTSKFRVSEVVHEAKQMLGYMQPKSAGFTTVNVQNDFEITGNRKGVYRAIQNLLKNAHSALQRSGRLESEYRISITVRREKGASEMETGVIEVLDNGVGMSPDQIPKIWEKGYTKSGTSGHGLGMGIVLMVFKEQLQGSIKVISEVGVGTTFLVRIPI